MEQRLLTDAAFNGDLETVKQLVEQGYDVNLEYYNGCVTRTPLDNAIENADNTKIENGNMGVIRYLIEKGAKINRQSEFGSPLHHAIDLELEEPEWHDEQGNIRPPFAFITTLLIELGADVNFKDENGITPLDDALMRGHIHAEKILRDNGAITSDKLGRGR